MMGTVPSYVLEGLSAEDCLSIFVKWAFNEGEEEKFPNLVEIGKEIVKKCRGVPLAVRTLGSSLFSKIDLDKWEFVRDHEIWNLQQKRDDILPALKLSYDEMPSHLRRFFAYFSLFPKDYVFEDVHITILWGALGLLQSRDQSIKGEDIAREYINELHYRSFLQDFKDFGHLYSFKVHDLLHDLALYVGKEEFLVVNSHRENIPQQVRHLSIVEHDSLSDALFPKSKSVRSILFPNEGVGLHSDTLLEMWISRYRYLRLLDLSDSSIEILPNSIAKLEHLQVLDLSNNSKIKRLPHSVCSLQNLQCLCLHGCIEIEMLPKGLGNLIRLRYLSITTKQSVLSEDEFASLTNLHALYFSYCHNLKFLFREAQLPSLEELFVQSCKINKLKMKFLNLYNFGGLQALPGWIEGTTDTLHTLIISNFASLEQLPEFLTRMTLLKRFWISYCPKLWLLPSDMHRLTALEDLTIKGCPVLCERFQMQSCEYWPMIAHIKHVSIGEP